MENFIIAITRTCGSGGTTISNMLAERYGINLYDKQLLRLASEDSGISEKLFAGADEDIKNSILYKVSRKVYQGELIPPESGDFTSDENLFNYQAKVLKELAKQQSYIVIGRAADYVLKDYRNLISVFLYAPLEIRAEHERERLLIDEKQALKHVKKVDAYRQAYCKYHTGRIWKNAENYDLALDTSKLGFEKTFELIKNYVDLRLGAGGFA
ncbi:MAG: cytidylate kinase-like family protein [Oscillospiraceae bacterium]|jgi:cytidylate kinase|nr:cytidylate kinase-like family protein [Oscillospiraceae bacterium]